jgi:hypothetical protein
MQDSIDRANRDPERSSYIFDSGRFGCAIHRVRSCVTKHKTHVTVISHPPHRPFVLRLCRAYRDFGGQSIPGAIRSIGSAGSDRVDNPVFRFLGAGIGVGSPAKRVYDFD